MYTLSVLRAWPNPQHLVCSDAIRGSRLLGHPELSVQVLSVSSHIRLTDDITTAFSRLTEGENVVGWVFFFFLCFFNGSEADTRRVFVTSGGV